LQADLLAMSLQPIPAGDVHRICASQVIPDLRGCVKELVENALDAGAKGVAVRLLDGGATAIEVEDDGSVRAGFCCTASSAPTAKQWWPRFLFLLRFTLFAVTVRCRMAMAGRSRLKVAGLGFGCRLLLKRGSLAEPSVLGVLLIALLGGMGAANNVGEKSVLGVYRVKKKKKNDINRVCVCVL
jgi:hypothetical protein